MTWSCGLAENWVRLGPFIFVRREKHPVKVGTHREEAAGRRRRD